MSIINYTVYSKSRRQTIFPWKISAVNPPSTTFVGFFASDVSQLLQDVERQLSEVYVGKTKDSLDLVSADLVISDVVPLFGPFVKYAVGGQAEMEASASHDQQQRNAFEVMMNAQGQLAVPDLIAEPRTGKQRLMNEVIRFLTEKGCQWRGSEVSSAGKSLVSALTDTLWAIDGHHHVFSNQGHKIPPVFSTFVGYNRPKHRKRPASNMSNSVLQSLSSHLFHCLQGGYWNRSSWTLMKADVEQLAQTLAKYSDYLEMSRKKTKLNQSLTSPVRELSDNLHFQFLPVRSGGSSTSALCAIQSQLEEVPNFQHISIEDFCPSDSRSKYTFIQTMKTVGFPFPTALLSYTHGNNIGNLYFVWKVNFDEESSFSDSQRVIEVVKKSIPVYHTRTMRKEMFRVFGRLTSSLKPAALRHIYRAFTSDAAAASSLSEAEVDKRVKLYVEMEDPDIVIDLRELQSGRASKFDRFWDECEKFLQEDIGLAVDERRHTQVTHMSRAISVRDLQEQIAARCPPSTPIPSISWLRLQFWPKSAHAHSQVHYTGRFSVKYMVQARQFRKDHEDAHYAAAVFRYQRECAVMFRQNSLFVCMDDKHRIKVGEPNYPVAAAERGKRVLVSRNQTFEVADHDFTKFSLIPSVSLVVDIPDDVTGSWYTGQVLIGLKEGAFEPSSPHRHVTELHEALVERNLLAEKSILFLYCDGGPDHRLTYLSVKLSLISFFLKNDLDFLCACRTAPFHSWRNPAERTMSIVNLGLQCVGLMREKMADSQEMAIASSNNLAQLRSVAEKNPEIKSAILDSIAPVKILLTTIFQRLVLHGKKFAMFTAAPEEKLREVWSELQTIDPLLEYGNVYRQASLKELAGLAAFLQHCCRSHHYSFSIMKCEPSCTFCKPVRMPMDTFKKIHHLPDPVPGADGHYRPFGEVFGTHTTEEHQPSLQAKKGRQKTLPFSASVQHVKNVDTMVQCEECQMWRLLYSKHKLNTTERMALQAALDNVTYTCGAQLQDMELSGRLTEVYARIICCHDPIEKLYYSVGTYELICIYCGSENVMVKESYYPQCSLCCEREPIQKRK